MEELIGERTEFPKSNGIIHRGEPQYEFSKELNLYKNLSQVTGERVVNTWVVLGMLNKTYDT